MRCLRCGVFRRFHLHRSANRGAHVKLSGGLRMVPSIVLFVGPNCQTLGRKRYFAVTLRVGRFGRSLVHSRGL